MFAKSCKQFADRPAFHCMVKAPRFAEIYKMSQFVVTGERDADKLCQGMSESGEKLVLGILRELAKLEGH